MACPQGALRMICYVRCVKNVMFCHAGSLDWAGSGLVTAIDK